MTSEEVYNPKIDCRLPNCTGSYCKVFAGFARDAFSKEELKPIFEETLLGCERTSIHFSEVGKNTVEEYAWPKTDGKACRYSLVVRGPEREKIMEKMKEVIKRVPTTDFNML